MGNKERRLAKNTSLLFLLTFSNYFFNFITVPYQTRILPPAIMGDLNFAGAVMTYFQLILDFGFLLSATQAVAEARDHPKQISRILSAVTAAKLGLIAASYLALGGLCLWLPRFQRDIPLFFLYLTAYSLYALLPDFLYRGLEEMKSITLRSVIIKAFFTLMIFILLKKPSQYYLIPILTAIGNLGALIATAIHLAMKGYRPAVVSFGEIAATMKKSAFFFLSRIASSVFTATNTFILGMLFGSGAATVGFYSTAEKGIAVAKQAIAPITDSLYPYMIRHRDFKAFKKILLFGMPLLGAACAVLIFFAAPLCRFIFGAEYTPAGQYLRLLAPVLFFSFPATLFGFPALSPLGLTRYANLSTVFGAVLQLLMIGALALFQGITAARLCVVTCITEGFVCLFRMIVFIKAPKKEA